jgi:hypothetical protein
VAGYTYGDVANRELLIAHPDTVFATGDDVSKLTPNSRMKPTHPLKYRSDMKPPEPFSMNIPWWLLPAAWDISTRTLTSEVAWDTNQPHPIRRDSKQQKRNKPTLPMETSRRSGGRHLAEVDDKVTSRAEEVVLVDPVLSSAASRDIRVGVWKRLILGAVKFENTEATDQ